MYLLRRAAVRSFASQLQARSFVTKTPTGLRQAQKWQVPVFQRRFASDEASPAQEKTSGETVTTEPTENEKAQQQEASESVTTEAQADKETDVVEESVATPDVADAAQHQSTVEQVAQNVSEKAQEAAQTMRQQTVSAAESILGESARGQAAGTYNDPKASKILYIGNLFFEVKAQDLEREFSRFGTVSNCRVAEDARGLSRGFGFIEFGSIEEAIEAQKQADQQMLAGRNMAVQFHVRREPNVKNISRAKQPGEPSKTLFIGNMSFQMSDKDLNDIFRPIRNVLDVRVAVDRRSGQPRGFCHADFIDVISAEAAKKILEEKEVYGRKLRVDFSRSSGGHDQAGGDRRRERRDGGERERRDDGERRERRYDGERRERRDDGERRERRERRDDGEGRERY